MSVYFNNKVYVEHKYDYEKDFEEFIYQNSTMLFGKDTILLDVKKKIDSGELGRAIPDGFLFDFSDPDDPKFFLIEVELQSHDFYRHIFPQITKFFAFVRGNTSQQAKLIDSLYRVIESDENYKKQFQKYLKGGELFKFVKDLIEGSGDILLIIDGSKAEIDEIKVTYSDTWGKYVKLVVARCFLNNGEMITFCEPDYELIDNLTDSLDENEEYIEEKQKFYTEDYHLADSEDNVKEIFHLIKESFPDITFNPQRYYISMKNGSNFAYIIVRKKLIRITALVPVEEVGKIVKNYPFKEPGEGVQRFYNAKCSEIKITNTDHMNEIVELLKYTKDFERIRIR